jgi:hypothetical protein
MKAWIKLSFLAILILSVFIFFACDSGSKLSVRYDGVYYYVQSKAETGGTSFLRFFSDGTVINWGSTMEPDPISHKYDPSYLEFIKNTRTKDDPNVGGTISIGNYEITGDQISFILKSSYGEGTYNGTIHENGLTLNQTYSGKEYIREYLFTSW